MRVYLDQIGCRLNYSEMDTLAQQLTKAGHPIVARPEDAQVIVFNTCAVTAGAERDSRKRVGALHRANPAAAIAVTGCWATLRPQAAGALPGVRLVTDNAHKELLPLLLAPWSAAYADPAHLARLHPDGSPLDFPSLAPAGDPLAGDPLPAPAGVSPGAPPVDAHPASAHPASAHPVEAHVARTRAFVKVQDGCDNQCTFCIVTALRGASRSLPLPQIVAEIARQAESGVQEAVLTGVHLGSYGRDLPGQACTGERTDLKQLVAAILAETAIPRLRLSSLEPWELADGFFDLWARWPARLCPHLHLPLQAGTDRQLRSMARRCTTASFARLLDDARARIPDLVVTTDLIAGFPGETAADCEQGLAFVTACRFAHAHVFPFSPRAGTAAARFADQAPTPVVRERVLRLQAAVAATGASERQRFLGTTRPVLWEGQGCPLADESGLLWSGLTDNYLRVHAIAPAEVNLHNRLLPTRLDALHGDVFHGTLLAGETIAADAPPLLILS